MTENSYAWQRARYARAVDHTRFYDEFNAMEMRRAQIEAMRNNSARLATQTFVQTSQGLGHMRMTSPLMFDIAFAGEPTFTQGAAVLKAPDQARYQDPIGTAGLRSWVRDSRGFYLGAWLYLRVDLYDNDGLPVGKAAEGKVSMAHHLLFTGVAYKVPDSDLQAVADTLVVRDSPVV